MHRRVLRVRQVAPSDPYILNRNENHRVCCVYMCTRRHDRRILAKRGRFPRQVMRGDRHLWSLVTLAVFVRWQAARDRETDER